MAATERNLRAMGLSAAADRDDPAAEDDGDWCDARGAASLSSVAIKRGAVMPTAPDNILAYWTSLCDGDSVPAPRALDGDHVAAQWPGAVLMRMVEGTPVLAQRFSGPDGNDGDAAATAMQIQWIQSLTREAVKTACPLREDTTFPPGTLAAGATRCRAIAVPLGEDGTRPDHALCWVTIGP